MYKQILFISALLLLALAGITRAQAAEKDSVILPQPVCGWEKLGELLIYPEIAKRAEIEGFFLFRFVIDSTGKPILLEVIPGYAGIELEKSRIEHITSLFGGVFNKVKWIPAKKNGKKIYCKIEIPVLMYLTEKNRPPLIIKQTPRPIIMKDISRQDNIRPKMD